MTKKGSKKSPQKVQQQPKAGETAFTAPVPVAAPSRLTQKNNDSEEEDLSPPSTFSAPSSAVPFVRCNNVVKVSFGGIKSGTASNQQQRAISPVPGNAKPLVHPSLSSDSLTSIHTNEQLLQVKMASTSGTSSRGSVSSTSSVSGDSKAALPLSLDKLSLSEDDEEKDLISVSLGDGSTIVTQAKTISGTTSNSVSLDTLSSSISQKRPTPLKQLEIIRQLIEQYNAPNANANQSVPSTSTMMAHGYLIHSVWLRDWYDYVSLKASAAARAKEPKSISNWELIEDKVGIENWKSKTTPILASSVSFTSLMQDQANASQNQHNEYFNSTFKLRANLQESFDYFILPKDAWEALYRWYGGGPPLPRIFDHALAVSPHFPLFYHVLDLLHSNSPKLGAPHVNGDTDTTVIQRHASRERAEQVMKQRSYLHAIELDIYPTASKGNDSKIPSVKDILDFQSKLSLVNVNEGNTSKDGEKLYSVEETTTKTTESKVNEKATAEVKATPPMGPCAVCSTKAKTRCSQCSSVYYCSKECQKVHWAKHKKDCKTLAAAAHAADKANQTASSSKSDKHSGKVGLTNMGNSCYMNSSLQCLSHIKPLTNFFISNRYESEINVLNRDGTKGELARTYAALLQDLWINTPSNVLAPGTSAIFARMNALTPKRFKSVLGRVNPEYAGVDQHDAHEVIELLLDKMHEDLNRISKKPYVENLEGDGTNDATIARDTWNRHSLREDSMIKDTVGSLMRSQLNCPTCGKVSVAYEYHNTVQIAIPRNYNITVTVVFIPEIPSTRCPPFVDSNSDNVSGNPMSVFHHWESFKPRKIAITLDRLCTIKTLKKMLKDQGHIPLEFMEMCNGDLIMVESACGNVTVGAPSGSGRKADDDDDDDNEDGGDGVIGDNKNKKKTSSMAVKNNRGTPKDIKVLSDERTVSLIGAQSIVYCYATCQTESDLAIVHMVSYTE
jgi:endogenous inhibitor of DNA gyrase (YacG/DUF329 family)